MHSIVRILFLSALLAMLLPPNLNAQQDPKADRYLQAVSGQFDMEESYRIEMDYIRKDIMRDTYAEGEGTIWMKGLKYKIVVDEFIVYYDGEKLYSQNTDAQEVYVSTPDPEEPGYLQAVPVRIIKSYEQDFKYRYIGETPFMGNQRIEVQLYPEEPSGPYSMLKMFIHPQTLKLEGIELKHKEGIVYIMVLRQVEEVQDLEPATFTFRQEKYPDTEMIELLE